MLLLRFLVQKVESIQGRKVMESMGSDILLVQDCEHEILDKTLHNSYREGCITDVSFEYDPGPLNLSSKVFFNIPL